MDEAILKVQIIPKRQGMEREREKQIEIKTVNPIINLTFVALNVNDLNTPVKTLGEFICLVVRMLGPTLLWSSGPNSGSYPIFHQHGHWKVGVDSKAQSLLPTCEIPTGFSAPGIATLLHKGGHTKAGM